MISNAQLLVPYLVPYLVYVGVGALPDSLGPAPPYAARLVLVPLALAWAWRWYGPLRGPRPLVGSVALGAGAGLVGTALWVALSTPFVEPGGEAWDDLAWGLRLLASGALPPVFEELLMRGWILGAVVQWEQARRAGADAPFGETLDRRSIHELEPGAWTPLAVGISSVVFALGHTPPEYLAGVAYGLLMAWLWIVRRDLVSCIAAHAVTNVTLALWVRASGSWGYW